MWIGGEEDWEEKWGGEHGEDSYLKDTQNGNRNGIPRMELNLILIQFQTGVDWIQKHCKVPRDQMRYREETVKETLGRYNVLELQLPNVHYWPLQHHRRLPQHYSDWQGDATLGLMEIEENKNITVKNK